MNQSQCSQRRMANHRADIIEWPITVQSKKNDQSQCSNKRMTYHSALDGGLTNQSDLKGRNLSWWKSEEISRSKGNNELHNSKRMNKVKIQEKLLVLDVVPFKTLNRVDYFILSWILEYNV